MKSLGFSSFRQLMDTWDAWLVRENQEDRIRTLLDGNELLFFFKKGNEYFGAPEESRLTFAKMKHPDGEKMDGASFVAFNLIRTIQGEPTKILFGKKDVKSIKIFSREKIEKVLLSKINKKENKPIKTNKKHTNKGMINIQDNE